MSGWRRLGAGAIAGGVAAMAITAAFVVSGVSIVPSAHAQSGWWPWGQEERPSRRQPEPREPMYGGPQQQQPWGPGARQPPGVPPQAGNNVCIQLEQRLVSEGQRGNQGRDVLPRIEGEMRQLERDMRAAQSQLDRSDCYETWLFSRTLRRTRQCVDMATRSEDLRRRLSDLDTQRQQIMGQDQRSIQDEIIRELARNNCGASYQQEARRRGGSGNPFSSLWQDEDSGPGARPQGNQFGALPYSTYRTLCVRLCDGYYFPVSFATLPNHFPRDAEVCQSKCAAPAELYYHQNPGGAVEQMVSISEQKPYTSLRNAFRHRKEYVEGCSCKQAEYVPSAGEAGPRKAEAAPDARPAPVNQRR